MRVRISKRILNAAKGRYDLVDHEGTINDLNSNMVMLSTANGSKSSPWWAIHDWEVMGEVEI